MRKVLTVIGVVTALVATGCGNSDKEATAPSGASGEKVAVNAPGVTDDEIRVGGVAAVTNPLEGRYGDAFNGVEAYFAMVNDAGGVHGRNVVLAEKKDDKFSNNKTEVEALINDPNIFAVVPVSTLLFTGADSLVAAGVPTFGWVINEEWQGTKEKPRANLFGQTTSFLCLGCPSPALPAMAKQFGKTRLGVLGYAAPQAVLCADGFQKSIDQYGPAIGASVVFTDKGLQYGDTNFSTQVKAMKDSNVDFVTTCLDTNGVVALAKEIKKQGLDAVQYLPNGYDHQMLEEFGDLFEGSLVRTDFTQWELPEADKPQGLRDFLTWMEKEGFEPSENSMVGWLNASLFVEGLRAAGPQFDRQKVIDAINSMTHVTHGGLTHGTDWTTAHFQRESETKFCEFVSVIRGSKFNTELSQPGKPFVCVDSQDPANLIILNEA